MTVVAQRFKGAISGSIIAVAMAVMNMATYGFTMLAARALGPSEYGALAALLGLLLVLNVLSLGLQATGARRVAAASGNRAGIEAALMRTTSRSALTLGGLGLVLAPITSWALDLDSWALPSLVAVAAVPLTIMGGQAGVLQGESRWWPLASIYLAAGLGRLVFGGVGLVLDGSAVSAMMGVTVGAFLPAVVGWKALQRTAKATGARTSALRNGLVREVIHNSHTLLAFLVLCNVDVVAARIVLDNHRAGLYAGGLILTKAVLFLPQFVVVVLFPSMSRAESARRMNVLALGLTLSAGLVVVGGAAVFPTLAVLFVGGSQYVEITHYLWLFAGLGTVLAMLQVMVYTVLARQRQPAVLGIWATVVALAAAMTLMSTVEAVVKLVLLADVLLLALLGSTASRRPGRTTSLRE